LNFGELNFKLNIFIEFIISKDPISTLVPSKIVKIPLTKFSIWANPKYH